MNEMEELVTSIQADIKQCDQQQWQFDYGFDYETNLKNFYKCKQLDALWHAEQQAKKKKKLAYERELKGLKQGFGSASHIEGRTELPITADTKQVGGDHYKSKTIQPWDVMSAWMTKEEFQAYLRGNVIKYIARYKDKNGVEDLKKARHYLDKLIEETN